MRVFLSNISDFFSSIFVFKHLTVLKRPLNKYYRSTRHISWIEIIPKYISPRVAAALSTLDATKRATHILDAKYAKADLQSIVKNNCQHLSADNQKKLLQLLVRFESLFDGTLGDWRTKPVSFQLKEGASPYHG